MLSWLSYRWYNPVAVLARGIVECQQVWIGIATYLCPRCANLTIIDELLVLDKLRETKLPDTDGYTYVLLFVGSVDDLSPRMVPSNSKYACSQGLRWHRETDLLLVHALTSVLFLIVHDVLDAIHLLVETDVGSGLVVHLKMLPPAVALTSKSPMSCCRGQVSRR